MCTRARRPLPWSVLHNSQVCKTPSNSQPGLGHAHFHGTYTTAVVRPRLTARHVSLARGATRMPQPCPPNVLRSWLLCWVLSVKCQRAGGWIWVAQHLLSIRLGPQRGKPSMAPWGDALSKDHVSASLVSGVTTPRGLRTPTSAGRMLSDQHMHTVGGTNFCKLLPLAHDRLLALSRVSIHHKTPCLEASPTDYCLFFYPHQKRRAPTFAILPWPSSSTREPCPTTTSSSSYSPQQGFSALHTLTEALALK